MQRGRKAIPDAIHALKGNPSKRRLHLEAPATQMEGPAVLPAVAPPDFLTDPREQEIFRRVVDDILQRRVARQADLGAYGRWAVYLHRWIRAKQHLDNAEANPQPKSGKPSQRPDRHPSFREMLDLEHVLQRLEDRLGLNPAARQAIISRLSAIPPAISNMVAEETKPAPPPDSSNPLAYLQQAGLN
jgi:phage terminase small subunit